MFEPVRGGTRGGQAEFKWTDVSADKDREHYLGHSINAPTGRWQKNKDIHWYSRDQKSGDKMDEEIRRIKELEANALSVALGFGPTSMNATQSKDPKDAEGAETEENGDLEKEDRKRLKAEKKEQKRANKEMRRLKREEDKRMGRRRATRSRSRSPRRQDRQYTSKGYRDHRRSLTPPQ